MTRITQSDQIMQLLRQQLQRLGQTTRSARGKGVSKHEAQRQSPLTRVSALAALDSVSDEDLTKALIRALLTEEFGDAFANEVKFDRVVSEVHRMIAEDADTARLLARGLGEVRGGFQN